MSRPTLLIALSLALATGPLLADETTVYKSKNADGTSVYTQIETRGAERRADPGDVTARERRDRADHRDDAEHEEGHQGPE